MKTKTKKINKTKSNSFARSPNSSRKSKSIDDHDLNENDQQQITNHQRDEFGGDAKDGDSDLENNNQEDQITNDVEEQEDREALRKKDEALGKEQV